jgi:O-antigen/teichoic acid export membrane protein
MGAMGSMRQVQGQGRQSPAIGVLLRSSVWAVIGDTASRGLLLVALMVCAQFLSPGDYGKLGLVRTTILTFVTFGGIGLGITANRFVAEHFENDTRFTGLLVGGGIAMAAVFGAVTSTVLWLSSPLIAGDLIGDAAVSHHLRWCAPIVLLGSIYGAQVGIMQGFGAFRELAIASTAQGVMALVLIPIGAATLAIDGAVFGILGYHVVGAVLLGVAIRRRLRAHGIIIRTRPLAEMMPIFLRFSLPAAIGGLAIAPFKWLAEAMLARHGGFPELGVFGAAMLLTTVLLSLVSALNAPMVAYFGRKHAHGDAQASSLNLYGTWYVFLVLAAPLLIWPPLASLPFGPDYRSAQFIEVTIWLLGYVGLTVYFGGIVRLMIQRGRLWLVVATTLIEGGALIAAFLLLKRYGAAGLAIAYVASYLARIAIAMPILYWRKALPATLLVDRMFWLTVTVFASVLVFHLGRLP